MENDNQNYKIGIDLVQVSRIEEAIARETLFQKAFSMQEQAYYNSCGSRPETLAGMYAAKEAIIKAAELGVLKVKLSEIEIAHKPSGAPFVVFSGNAAKLFINKEVQISISHDGGFAIAIALLTNK